LVDDFFGRGFSHVEDFDLIIIWKGGTGVVKEPFHGPGIAGGDLNVLTFFDQFCDPLVFPGGHFTEIGNAFEGFPGFTKPLEDFVLGRLRDYLGKGTATIENFPGRLAQSRRSWKRSGVGWGASTRPKRVSI
jgi:hypothetical protein